MQKFMVMSIVKLEGQHKVVKVERACWGRLRSK